MEVYTRGPFPVLPVSLPSLLGLPVVEATLWNQCLRRLEEEIPAQQFNTWIRPLQAVEAGGRLRLLAPNRYVVDWVNQNCAHRIIELVDELVPSPAPELVVEVGSRRVEAPDPAPARPAEVRPRRAEVLPQIGGRLNADPRMLAFVDRDAALTNYGRELFDARRYDEALNAFEAALAQTPDGLGRRKLSHNIAAALLARGDPAGAVARLEVEARRPDALDESLLLYARALDALGRGQEAAAVRRRRREPHQPR